MILLLIVFDVCPLYCSSLAKKSLKQILILFLIYIFKFQRKVRYEYYCCVVFFYIILMSPTFLTYVN